MKRKAAHAGYIRFWRSSQSRKCPDEIRDLYDRFKRTGTYMTTPYEDFLGCGGNCRNAKYYQEIMTTRTNSTQGVRHWLTREQMLEYFSEEDTDATILKKESDTTFMEREARSHPELDRLRHYLVFVQDSQVDVSETTIKDILRMTEKKGWKAPSSYIS